jgi:hypothetical protein
VIVFTEFVNCESNGTTAVLHVEKICDAASTDKDMGEESYDMKEQPVPTFEEAAAGFEMVQ